jgi:hypothetical protein
VKHGQGRKWIDKGTRKGRRHFIHRKDWAPEDGPRASPPLFAC